VDGNREKARVPRKVVDKWGSAPVGPSSILRLAQRGRRTTTDLPVLASATRTRCLHLGAGGRNGVRRFLWAFRFPACDGGAGFVILRHGARLLPATTSLGICRRGWWRARDPSVSSNIGLAARRRRFGLARAVLGPNASRATFTPGWSRLRVGASGWLATLGLISAGCAGWRFRGLPVARAGGCASWRLRGAGRVRRVRRAAVPQRIRVPLGICAPDRGPVVDPEVQFGKRAPKLVDKPLPRA
jgi:hypothetical protein